jgi:hypothetical protein
METRKKILEDIEIKINRLCSHMSSASRKKGWVGILCDTGSSHDGQRVTLTTDITDEDRCSIQCEDGTHLQTFGRLLMDAYIHGVDFNIGDKVSIIEPGAVDDTSHGIILKEVQKDKMVKVQLIGGKFYWGFTRNLNKL